VRGEGRGKIEGDAGRRKKKGTSTLKEKVKESHEMVVLRREAALFTCLSSSTSTKIGIMTPRKTRRQSPWEKKLPCCFKMPNNMPDALKSQSVAKKKDVSRFLLIAHSDVAVVNDTLEGCEDREPMGDMRRTFCKCCHFVFFFWLWNLWGSSERSSRGNFPCS